MDLGSANSVALNAEAVIGVSYERCKSGVFISPGSVRSVWLRHVLEVFDKRLKAVEAFARR